MFSERLKELRNKLNISQYKLAKDLNLSRSAISAYELNKRQPDFEMLEKMADYFNVSIDYLIGRSNSKTYDEHVFHSDFESLSEKLENANPETRKIVVNILDKIFLSVFSPLHEDNLELLSYLHDIYNCIYALNSSLSSNCKNISLNKMLEINAVEALDLKEKLKILSKYKNDLNILLDDLFEYYLKEEKPTE